MCEYRSEPWNIQFSQTMDVSLLHYTRKMSNKEAHIVQLRSTIIITVFDQREVKFASVK